MVLDNDCLVAGELEFGRGSFTTCSGLSEKIQENPGPHGHIFGEKCASQAPRFELPDTAAVHRLKPLYLAPFSKERRSLPGVGGRVSQNELEPKMATSPL